MSPHPGLMLGRCAFGLQALFLDLSLTLKINGLLALRTVGNDAGGEHWHEASSHRVGDDKVQDAYSLRCAPQVASAWPILWRYKVPDTHADTIVFCRGEIY